MKHFIVLEIFLTNAILCYSRFALFPKLMRAQHRLSTAKSIEQNDLENALQQITYNGSPLIWDYIRINCKPNIHTGQWENSSGKQACDFIDEDKILKSISHIALLKAFPSIITSAGLCCTFIAILLGLSAVQVSADGNIQGITGLVNNLAGKFSTSIAALVLAILINLYSSVFFAKIHKAFLTIEKAIDHLIPVRSVSQEIATNMANEFSKEFMLVADKFNQSFKDFTDLVRGEELKEQLANGENLVDTLSKALTQLENYTNTAEDFVNQIIESSANLEEFNTNMANTKDTAVLLASLTEQLRQNEQILGENYDDVVHQLEEMRDNFTQVSRDARTFVSDEFFESLQQALKEVLDLHVKSLRKDLTASGHLLPASSVNIPPTANTSSEYPTQQVPPQRELGRQQPFTTASRPQPNTPIRRAVAPVQPNAQQAAHTPKPSNVAPHPQPQPTQERKNAAPAKRPTKNLTPAPSTQADAPLLASFKVKEKPGNTAAPTPKTANSNTVPAKQPVQQSTPEIKKAQESLPTDEIQEIRDINEPEELPIKPKTEPPAFHENTEEKTSVWDKIFKWGK